MEKKDLIIKTLLISFAIHFIIFNLFTFTFPVKEPGHKPKIVFLGSILKTQNIENNSFYQNKGQKIFNSTQFTEKDYQFKETPFNIAQKQKPDAGRITEGERKPVEKSIFKIDYSRKTSKDSAESSMEKKYQSTPYVPIKLETSGNWLDN